MYAKSMLEYARERVVASAWARHLNFVPVALALTVASLPFMLERQFVQSAAANSSNSHSGSNGSTAPGFSSRQNAPHSEPLSFMENPFRGLVLANVVTAPKRAAMPLDAQQRAVAGYITRKFGVSVDVVQELVRTAFAAGQQFGVDPLLVVAIMAVESSFNPIAESVAGAKGLMQIIPKYHLDKFADFGGEHTVFDPRVNILVGARIVREYLLMASGDLFTALQTYAGALADRDAAYTNRVLNEKDQLDALAGFPKTDRGNRVTMQVESLRPGTVAVPKLLAPVPLSGPVTGSVAMPAVPATPAATSALPATATLPMPSAAQVTPSSTAPKSAEEPRHTPPLVPQQPALSGVNLTLVLPETVLRF